jgi:hypothetical protein
VQKRPFVGRCAVLVVALRKLLSRRAEAFEAGLPGEGTTLAELSAPQRSTMDTSEKSSTLDNRGGPIWGQEQ